MPCQWGMFILHIQDQFYLKQFGTEELINSQHAFKHFALSKTFTFSFRGCSDVAEEISTKWKRRLGHEVHTKEKSYLNHACLSAASNIKGLLIVQWKEANECDCNMDKVWRIVMIMTLTNKRRQYKHK